MQTTLSVGQHFRLPNRASQAGNSWWDNLNQYAITASSALFESNWTQICTYCGSSLLDAETDGWCCNKGKWIRPLLKAYPAAIEDIINTHKRAISSLSRPLNNLFAFSAMGTTGRFIPFQGPANVAITGRIYHRLLHIDQGSHSMRWFLYDGEDARREAGQRWNIPLDLLNAFRQHLDEVNPFVRTIRHAITSVGNTSTPLSIRLDGYIAATEMGALLYSTNMQRVNRRQVVFYRNTDQQPEFLDILSPLYEPLQYPILFPDGSPGWAPKDQNYNLTNLSQIQWYRFALCRERRFLQFGRLTCEYLVDMFSRVEEQRLPYQRLGRSHQVQRQELQQQVLAPLPGGSGSGSNYRYENTLSASFMGSRAWASEQVANALALCRELGAPSLFITFTTNPTWPEITSKLLPGQTAADISTIVVRAFYARLKKFKR